MSCGSGRSASCSTSRRRRATPRRRAGNRLSLGMTLRIAAVVFARLGEAEPAAVLSGAFSAHFPPSLSAVHKGERMEIRQAQSLARHALREAAYSAALGQGAAMDDDELVGYAQSEVGRLAALLQKPARRHRNQRPARGGRAAGNDRATRQDNVPQQGWRGQAPRSSQPARR